MFKTFALAAVASAALVAGTANALPVFSMGSFAFTTASGNGITTVTDVTTTTSFALVNNSFSTTQPIVPPSNDFTQVVIPTTLTLSASLDFGTLSDFNFSDAGLGTFTATSAVKISSISGVNASATWEVLGSYTPGNLFDPTSPVETGSETFVFSQTGGPGQQISVAATFFSPAVLPPSSPEPATISLFGAALAGLGAIRRRRK